MDRQPIVTNFGQFAVVAVILFRFVREQNSKFNTLTLCHFEFSVYKYENWESQSDIFHVYGRILVFRKFLYLSCELTLNSLIRNVMKFLYLRI